MHSELLLEGLDAVSAFRILGPHALAIVSYVRTGCDSKENAGPRDVPLLFSLAAEPLPVPRLQHGKNCSTA